MTTPSTLHMYNWENSAALQRGSEGKKLLVCCHEGKPMAISAACSACSLEILLRSSRLCALRCAMRATCSYLLASNCATGGALGIIFEKTWWALDTYTTYVFRRSHIGHHQEKTASGDRNNFQRLTDSCKEKDR